MVKIKILSTKKLSASLINDANKKGITIIEKEFISIQPIRNGELESGIKNLSGREEIFVFTSAHAVDILKDLSKEKKFDLHGKVFCLSAATKQAVLEAGFRWEITGEAEDGSGLAQVIIDSGVRHVNFFCSNRRRNELPELLKNAGIEINELVIYQTIETPEKFQEPVDGVTFFSPSAVQSFFSINQLDEDVVCFAIGKTTENTLRSFIQNKIVTSRFPSQSAMMEAVQIYFKQNRV